MLSRVCQGYRDNNHVEHQSMKVLQYNMPRSAVNLELKRFVLSLHRFLQGVSVDDTNEVCTGRVSRSIPHTTLLPGLQFSLAGIVGKPETFYTVPAVRFAYEVLSYM